MRPISPEPAPLDHDPAGTPGVGPDLRAITLRLRATASETRQATRRVQRLVDKMRAGTGSAGTARRDRSQIRSVLAAVDLEGASADIVRAAAAIAHRAGAELHLIHALSLNWIPAREPESYSRVVQDRTEAAAGRIRDLAAAAVPPEVVPASAQVRVAPPHQAIPERAAEVAADLIVLGPHRGGIGGARVLGTTADRVLRTAGVPCLVVRDSFSLPVHRIGVPTDLSTPARHALELALAWSPVFCAGADGEAGAETEIRVMHMSSPPARGTASAAEARIRPELLGQVSGAARRVPGATGTEIRSEILWGAHPAQVIESWVDRERIPLVVMGTHGRSGLGRALIGSAALEVARRTPCPLLLVPPGVRIAGVAEPPPVG